MAYGTPAGPGDVETYYTDIRRGRPPTPEQLADLVRRYDAIGGVSPLRERTEAQRAALQRALDDRAPGRFEVVLGFKHAAPSIEDAVAGLRMAGITRLVALVLAPHYSTGSVGEYLTRARAAAGDTMALATIESWATEPAYVTFLAGAVTDALAQLPSATKVLFTAHSLPVRVVSGGDPYRDELRATAEAVAEHAGLARWAGFTVAWQSASPTPEPWLEPDVRTVIEDLAATGRAEGVLVCPCGFVSDHLEVLYDVDIQARGVAEGAGLAFGRARVVNDDATVMQALAERVLQAE
jgi:protoporphyrin/coproporphyrin ferrochelatase